MTTNVGPERSAFVDTEPSNWTWDPVREQHYWHRFFHHQPDLNYDNPEVAEAMLDVVRYWWASAWMDFVSMRCRTSSSETVPTARTCLRPMPTCARCEKLSARSSLAGCFSPKPTEWPAMTWSITSVMATNATCASTSRSCRACSWRPAKGRARSRRSWPRRPRYRRAQWGIFLRSHDELTLEMVSEDERDYMYSEYAKTRA